MPDKFGRRERGEGNGPGRSPGHERATRPTPLPRRQPLPRSADGLPALGTEFDTTVQHGLALLGLELSGGVQRALDAHARLLLAWNQQINLTALRSPEQVARGHVLDSLTAAELCRRLIGGAPRSGSASEATASRASLLDLGSGGGYPGLPLAIALGVARCLLVDSVGKKAAFLDVAAATVADVLRSAAEPAPRFEVLAERAEDLAEEPDQREGWDLVVARAVGSLAEVVELALPLLARGGHLVAWKRRSDPDGSGSGLDDELRAARPVVQATGGARMHVEPAPAAAELGLAGHVLVTVRKVRPTPDRYPRAPAERRRAALLT